MVLKRTLSIFLAVLMIGMTFTAFPITVNAASNTWNPDHGVYDITTEDDLFAFRDSLDAGKDYDGIEINLLNDIEISQGTTYVSPCANRDEGLYVFCGTFNGNNHTISNLNMVSSDDSTVSFLPILYNGTIKDLTLKDVTIENGTTWNAAFVSISYGNDKIINCHLTGNCTIKPYDSMPDSKPNFNGGIVGSKYSRTLTIENCSVGDADSDIIINTPNGTTSRTASHAGGILGYVREGACADIISTDNYADVGCDLYAGGIIGAINGTLNKTAYTLIKGCHNYGEITSSEYNTNGDSILAGIVGYENPYAVLVIDQRSNHADVIAKCRTATDIGGIVGSMGCAAILNTYNTGTIRVSQNYNTIGGIVGLIRVMSHFEAPSFDYFDYYPENSYNAIINCYNTGEVIGNNTNQIGGICGIIQDLSEQPIKSVIKNAYNFATVSGTNTLGEICGTLHDTVVQDVYAPNNTHAIEAISINHLNPYGVDGTVSEVGYYDTPDVTGTIYPATVKASSTSSNVPVEVISSTPLTGNLLYLLNEKVKEYNAELETSGSDYRYLTWKMTNPASEDGSKGVTVHPMFGVQEFDIKFYPNFSDNEEPIRTYTAADLVMGKVPVFYDLPEHEGYIFKGWYLDKANDDDDSPISFDTIYTQSTDIYAHWIKVENVDKDDDDETILPAEDHDQYGGFDLAGVQIRKKMLDHNFEEVTPGGMRFITSLNMDVVNEINKIQPNNIEYGYVAATHKGWIDYHCDGVKHGSDEKLKYVSETANGIDTSSAKATNENYFGFAKNVNCTSKVTNSKNGVVRRDHQIFDKYLLYSLVITYEEKGSDKGKDVLARPYIRYTDANGLERVAYSEYTGTNVLGGCYTNYNRVADMAGN